MTPRNFEFFSGDNWSAPSPNPYGLYVFDPVAGQEIASQDLPFWARDFAPLDDGRFVVWGHRPAPDNPYLSEGGVAAVVDPLAATVELSILEDLRAAAYTEDPERRDDIHREESFDPGFAVDAQGGRLYVAHADEDRISAYELPSFQRITSSRLEAPTTSLIERLLRWTAAPVEAKSGRSVSRSLELSPDGERLWMTGTEWRGSTHGLGLAVVDAGSLKVTALREDVAWAYPSPDGRRLYAGCSTPGSPADAHCGLLILDSETLAEIAHLGPGANLRIVGVGSSAVYALRNGGASTSAMLQALSPDGVALGSLRHLGSAHRRSLRASSMSPLPPRVPSCLIC